MNPATLALIVAGTGFIGTGAALTKDKPVQSSRPNKRRTRDDYTSTSFSFVPKTFTAMKPMQQMTQPRTVQQMVQPVSMPQPVAIKPMSPNTKANAWSYTKDPVYNYYNDPYQVNSLVDVVFNKAGKDLALEDMNAEWATNIPVLQELVVGVDYIKRSFVEPVVKGKFSELGINALMSSGEDMDIIANPVKGLILDGGKGFVRGLGAGHEGRTQYDYNAKTGNGVLDFVINMGAEIVSDPLNLITMGGKQALKSMVNEVGEAALKTTTKEVEQDVAQSFGKTLAAQLLTEDAIKTGKITGGQALDNVYETLRLRGVDDEIIKTLATNVEKQINLINSKRILKSIATLTNYADKLDSTIFRVTPVGMALTGAGKAVGAGSSSIVNMIKNRTLKAIDNSSILTETGTKVLPLEAFSSKEVVDEINTLQGTIVKDYHIDGIQSPKHSDLVKYYRLWGYNETRSADEFLEELKQKELVSDAYYNVAKTDEKFTKYFDYNVREESNQIKTIHDTIANSDAVLNASINESMSKAKSKLDQTVIISKELSKITNTTGDLPTQYAVLYKEQAKLQDKVSRLGSEIDEANLALVNKYILTFNNVLENYKINLEALPDIKSVDILHEVLNYKQSIINSGYPDKVKVQMLQNIKSRAAYARKQIQLLDLQQAEFKDLEWKAAEVIDGYIQTYDANIARFGNHIRSAHPEFFKPTGLNEPAIQKYFKGVDPVIESVENQQLKIQLDEYRMLVTERKLLEKALLTGDVSPYAFMREEMSDTAKSFMNNTGVIDYNDSNTYKDFTIINDNPFNELAQAIDKHANHFKHLRELEEQKTAYENAIDLLKVDELLPKKAVRSSKQAVDKVRSKIADNTDVLKHVEFTAELVIPEEVRAQVRTELDEFFNDMKAKYHDLEIDYYTTGEYGRETVNPDRLFFDKLNEVSELRTPNEYYTAMEILNDMGKSYDLEAVNLYSLMEEQKKIGEKLFQHKYNQLYTATEILKDYNNNEEFRTIINDLALDEKKHPLGAFFNTLSTIDTSRLNLLTQDLSAIKEFKRQAKTQVNFETILTVLANHPDNRNANLALLDLMTGDNRKFADAYASYIDENDVFNIERFINDLDYKVNPRTYSGAAKNGNLHAVLYGDDIDTDLLHNAKYDAQITWENLVGLANRGQINLDYSKQYTVFDLETTSMLDTFKPGDQIVQIAASRYAYSIEQGWHIVGEIDMPIKVKSLKKITPELRQLWGEELTQQIIESSIDTDTATKAFIDFINGSEVVGHNIKNFDIPYFKKVTGIDITNEAVDTLSLAKKLLGYEPINPELANELGKYYKAYLKLQRKSGAKRVVEIVDKKVFDAMFDFGRNYMSLVGKNMLDSKDLITQLQANKIEEGLQRLLGKADVAPTDKAVVALNKNIMLDSIADLDVSDEISLIKTLRSTLADIKHFNNERKLRYTTASALGKYSIDLGADIKATNPYAFYNGMEFNPLLGNKELVNKYVASNISTRSVSDRYNKKFFKRFDERIKERVAKRTVNQDTIIKQMEIINDPNSDVITRLEANNVIAAIGYNKDQAARIYNFAKMYNSGAKIDTKLPEATKGIMARSTQEYSTIMQDTAPFVDKLEQLTLGEYNAINDARAVLETKTILSANPKELSAFITDNAGFMVIADRNNKGYVDSITRLLSNKDELVKYGYRIVEKPDVIYIVPDASSKQILEQVSADVNKRYGFTAHKYNFVDENVVGSKRPEIVKEMLAEADKINNKYNMLQTDTRFLTDNTAVNLVNAEKFRSFKDALPADVLENTLLNDEEYLTSFLKTTKQRMSYFNLGSVAGRRTKDSFYQPALSADVTKVEDALKRIDATSKYIQTVFNNDLSVDGSLFKNMSDQDILDIYNHDNKNYTFMILNTTEQGKPVVQTFKPSTVEHIAELKRLHAVLAPQYFSNAVINTINKEAFTGEFSNMFLQVYYKYIVSTYKSLYLSSIGMVVRNVNDILTKNLVGGSLTDVPTDVLSFLRALKDWRLYEQDIADLIKINGGLTKEAIADYFKKGLARLDNTTFSEIHEYATSNISAGMAQAQSDLIKNFYVKDKPSKFDEVFFNNAFRKYTVDAVMDVNSYVEHAGRLSNLRMGKLQGLDQVDAYNKVLRTHFDYGVRTKARMYAELLIPFVTFPMYNLQYWTDAAFESPWLMEVILDAARTSLDVEDQKQFTIDNSQQFQTALLNGNILIGNTLLKLNPSLMDAFQLVATPSTQLEQRLIAPVKLGVNLLTKKDYLKNRYSNNYVTDWGQVRTNNKLQNAMSDVGLYPLYRPIEFGEKFVKSIERLSDESIKESETLNGIEDYVPSLFRDYTTKYGNKISEDWMTTKRRTAVNTVYTTQQTQTGKVVGVKVYPSSKSIPYTKRYYSSRSYNSYSKWKAMTYAYAKTGTIPNPASMAAAYKELLYKMGYNPKTLKYYNKKLRTSYRT